MMDVKIILKIHMQQKQVTMFHQVFQCLQYRHLKYKINMMCAEIGKIGKTAWILKRTRSGDKLLLRRKKEVINKRSAGIIWKCKHLL